jgi:hydroxysqualene synthase
MEGSFSGPVADEPFGMNNIPDIAIGEVLSGKSGKDENFPVASWLIAPRHRGIILAFYRFVRAADDVVDHPTLATAQRHSLIDRLEAGLLGHVSEPEAEPLRLALAERSLPAHHALDMLVAFRRDIEKARTATWDELVDYCRYSAMPVGRFVLDVHGEDEQLHDANDALCAALQIINHLQDCAADLRQIDRVYLPEDRMAHHGVTPADLGAAVSKPGLRALFHEMLDETRGLLVRSASFASTIRDTRLALEVAVIQSVAERLTRQLELHDPLSQDVHLSKVQYALTGLAGATRMGFSRLFGGVRPLPGVSGRHTG